RGRIQAVEARELLAAHADDGCAVDPFDRVDVELLEEGADVAHVADLPFSHQNVADLAAPVRAVVADVFQRPDLLAGHEDRRVANLDLLLSAQSHHALSAVLRANAASRTTSSSSS